MHFQTMDTFNLKFALLKLNPFLISLGFHSLALAAVVFGSAQSGLPLSSMGDLSIELVGVDGGQGGQGQKPVENKIKASAKKIKAVSALQKVDEFSVSQPAAQMKPQPKARSRAGDDTTSQASNKAQKGQTLNIATVDSSGLAGRPGSQGGGALQRTYIQNLYSHLERNKHYPMLARKMRIEGQVHVSFHVLRDGTIENVQILESCGAEVLNQAAIKTVKRASGRWPLPSSIRGDALPMEISFNFQIN